MNPGFGLHIKQEGSPVHPDDIEGELSNRQYLRQLIACCKSNGIDITKEGAYHFIMRYNEETC